MIRKIKRQAAAMAARANKQRRHPKPQEVRVIIRLGGYPIRVDSYPMSDAVQAAKDLFVTQDSFAGLKSWFWHGQDAYESADLATLEAGLYTVGYDGREVQVFGYNRDELDIITDWILDPETTEETPETAALHLTDEQINGMRWEPLPEI